MTDGELVALVFGALVTLLLGVLAGIGSRMVKQFDKLTEIVGGHAVMFAAISERMEHVDNRLGGIEGALKR